MSKINGTILRSLLQGGISLIFLLAACSRSANPSPLLTPITVQLAWTHQAQFAGFYATDQNGYFAAEGLVVTFLTGGPGVDTVGPVLSGNAHSSLAAADVFLLARSEGKPVNAMFKS